MKKNLLGLLSLLLVCLTSSCSFIGSATVDHPDSMEEESASSQYASPSSDERAAQQVSLDKGVIIFPHLPVPVELEKVGSDTVVFTTTEFHGGLFTLKGSLSKDSAMNFFLRRMPEEGWRLAGRLESETCYMAFINSTGGSCLIHISKGSMSFSTEVRIYVTEGIGQPNDIR